MMAAESTRARLIERLPPVRGRLSENAPLAQVTWFRVGGPAEVLFRPADVDDLASFLAQKPKDVPVTVIGVASNLLVRDGGVAGVVVRLGRGFVEIKTEGNDRRGRRRRARPQCRARVRHGRDRRARIHVRHSRHRRRRPAHERRRLWQRVQGRADRRRSARRCRTRTIGCRRAELGLSYRHCDVPEDWIFVAARFRGQIGDRDAIGRRMAEIQAAREATQPIRARTGGSTFANPPGEKAWELIDRAGCRGLRRGGAMVSEQHANFLINTGDASAADIEGLGEEVRRRVREKTGIELRWEIRRIGRPSSGGGA